MKLLYTHPTLALVIQARSTLELAGIACTVRNEYAAGGIGELAPIDAWPELWISRDRDYERAKQLIDRSRTAEPGEDWTCTACGHDSPGSFELCWHCAAPAPAK